MVNPTAPTSASHDSSHELKIMLPFPIKTTRSPARNLSPFPVTPGPRHPILSRHHSSGALISEYFVQERVPF